MAKISYEYKIDGEYNKQHYKNTDCKTGFIRHSLYKNKYSKRVKKFLHLLIFEMQVYPESVILSYCADELEFIDLLEIKKIFNKIINLEKKSGKRITEANRRLLENIS